MKNILMTGALLMMISLAGSSYGQSLPPVTWSFNAEKTAAGAATLLIKATMQDGWHIYALNNPANSPVRMAVSFLRQASWRPEGKVIQPEPLTRFEKLFGLNVSYFEKEVVFRQQVTLTQPAATVSGTVEFTACSEQQCLPPQTISFTIHLNR
ncbi:sugar transporter [Chitinophaga sp. Mgbs1]|uniref:Sugar transporter n=1 Tax=Chitinophaga solisilvae TaxID=1233460 RepID=A0A3S1BPC2_9BACT|nr:sugar transporter [Chitinophaga solisilvae]